MKKVVFCICVIFLSNVLQAQIKLDSGLVAHYPFNGNVIDVSGNSNNGTLNGVSFAIDRFGNMNSACFFDGEDDYISLPFGLQQNPTDSPYSISLWVQSTNVNELEMLFSSHTDAYDRLYLGKYNGLWTFGINDSPWSENTATIASNEWTHLTLNLNGVDAKFYINGLYVGKQQYGSFYLGDNFNIGAQFNYLNEIFWFNGKLDDIRVYNRALSNQEIQFLYKGGGINDIDKGLIAYYPFSGNAMDESGNGNHGVVNGASVSFEGLGNINGAYYFDGADDYISLPFGLDQNPSDLPYSISLWVRSSNNHELEMLFNSHTNSNDRLYIGKYNGQWTFGVNNSPWSENTADSANNQWNHLVLNLNGIDAELYINGIFAGMKQYDSFFLGENFNIGAQLNYTLDEIFWFNGFIDEVRIYKRALSNSEIQFLFAKELINVQVNVKWIEPYISVYPNPVEDLLNIYSPKSVSSIMVFDLTGKVLLELKDFKYSINVSNLSKGSYILKVVYEDGGIGSTEFIKQ